MINYFTHLSPSEGVLEAAMLSHIYYSPTSHQTKHLHVALQLSSSPSNLQTLSMQEVYFYKFITFEYMMYYNAFSNTDNAITYISLHLNIWYFIDCRDYRLHWLHVNRSFNLQTLLFITSDLLTDWFKVFFYLGKYACFDMSLCVLYRMVPKVCQFLFFFTKIFYWRQTLVKDCTKITVWIL